MKDVFCIVSVESRYSDTTAFAKCQKRLAITGGSWRRERGGAIRIFMRILFPAIVGASVGWLSEGGASALLRHPKASSNSSFLLEGISKNRRKELKEGGIEADRKFRVSRTVVGR